MRDTMILGIKREDRPLSEAGRRAALAASVALAISLLSTSCNATPTAGGTTPMASPTAMRPYASTATSSTVPPSSTSITPSTKITPRETPPVANIPSAARPNTKAGAREFVRYYINQVVTAWSTANPKILEGLYDSECEWCTAMVETAADFQRKGDRYIGSPFDVKQIQFLAQAQGFTAFLVIGSVPKAKVVKANGSLRRVIDPEYATFEVTCWYKGHWQATRVRSVGR